MIQRPRGTQDFLPDMVEKWHYLEGVIRQVCRDYGYQEIRTPMFEVTELFQRGVGETTDIVQKEMYSVSAKDEDKFTLRPEGTASVCRAYVENKLYGGNLPVKLYYMGPMFRHERPQAGRFRQFHQFGVEVLGADQPMVDAEVISLAWDIYRRLGIIGLELHINSVGCPECRKEHRKALQEFLRPHREELCSDCQNRFEKNPLRILDCKKPHCREISQGAPTTLDMLCSECAEHFAKLKAFLDGAGVPYQVDPRLVRGLDYYQKTAFEIMAEDIGAQSAVCGGGRYDGLVEEIGGPRTPGIGFAMGLERAVGVLEKQNKFPEIKEKNFAVLISLGEAAQKRAFAMVNHLRSQSIPVGIDLLDRSLKSQLKGADREGAKLALILGEEELARGVIIMRDLVLGEQTEISLADGEKAVIEKYGEVCK